MREDEGKEQCWGESEDVGDEGEIMKKDPTRGTTEKKKGQSGK